MLLRRLVDLDPGRKERQHPAAVEFSRRHAVTGKRQAVRALRKIGRLIDNPAPRENAARTGSFFPQDQNAICFAIQSPQHSMYANNSLQNASPRKKFGVRYLVAWMSGADGKVDSLITRKRGDQKSM